MAVVMYSVDLKAAEVHGLVYSKLFAEKQNTPMPTFIPLGRDKCVKRLFVNYEYVTI